MYKNPHLRADAKYSYDQLLQSATTIFSAQGSAATLQSIAKQAGVGIGTLYRHFPSRKSLLEALYADKLTDLVGKASGTISSNQPNHDLADWLKMILDYIARYGGFRDLLLLEIDDRNSPLIKAGSTLLTNAQKSGSLRADVTIDDLLRLVGAITATTPNENPNRSNTLLSVIVAGLRPENHAQQ